MDENFGGKKLVYFQYIIIVIGGKLCSKIHSKKWFPLLEAFSYLFWGSSLDYSKGMIENSIFLAKNCINKVGSAGFLIP